MAALFHRRARLRGFTLLELLIAIALSAIIMSTVGLLLESGMNCWLSGFGDVSLQSVGQEIFGRITDGDYKIAGLREAQCVLRAGDHSIDFVPLWQDVVPARAGQREFPLARRPKSGSAAPLIEAKKVSEEDFRIVPADFIGGVGKEPDRLVLTKPLGADSIVRISFVPDDADPGAVASILWDSATQTLLRRYRGREDKITDFPFAVKIAALDFEYYNAMNVRLPATELSARRDSARSMVSAVRVYLRVGGDGVQKEFATFVNLRSRGQLSQGIPCYEGLEFEIPGSDHIRDFSLSHFTGVREGARLRLVVRSGSGRSWAVTLTFSAPTGMPPSISRYSLEYPENNVIASGFLNLPVSRSVNLLKIGDDPHYDYDRDTGVDDIVRIDGQTATLRVDTMQIEGAALTVR